MNDLIELHGLTPLQAAAVSQFFLCGFNKTKAARKVGCSVSIFNGPEVKAVIKSRSDEIQADSNMTAVGIINNLSDIASANIGDYFDFKDGRPIPKRDLDYEALACVSEMRQNKDGEVTIKLHDKFGAVDRLSKLLGWVDNDMVVKIEDQSAESIDRADLARKVAFAMRSEGIIENNEDSGEVTNVTEDS